MKLLSQLRTVAGTQYVAPFHFVDTHQLAASCSVVVQPASSWAVAIDPPAPTNTRREDLLREGSRSLAACLCQQFGLAPGSLVLFHNYVYSGGYESVYRAHFAAATHDLFAGVRFTGPSRVALDPDQVRHVLQHLLAGLPLPAAWRALQAKVTA